ncbi:tyrosinase central domain-containing protein [Apiospora aurea]|uniref:Tyrosinase central domain-containing protein n=1 Tax=Apiospora aurea TaxID=335848 RepID=A0ABR1QQM9_9PEZI
MRVSIPVLGALLLAGADARVARCKHNPSASSASHPAVSSAETVVAPAASSYAQSPAASSPAQSPAASYPVQSRPAASSSAQSSAVTSTPVESAATSSAVNSVASSTAVESTADLTTTSKAVIETASSSAAASTTAVSSQTTVEASSASTTAVTSAAVSSSATTNVVTSILPSSSSTSIVVVPSTSMSTTKTKAPAATNYPRTYPADVVDKLRDSSLSKLETYSSSNLAGGSCTLETASIRREWSDLSPDERVEYTTAVRCLQQLPSKSDAKEVPGARSRFDDFMAVHMTMTPWIHNSANFLAWHRYYLFTYEKALKEECGYKGTHPYWNWDRYASDPVNSPLFNGNASSMGVASGCNTEGPFADYQVNLGPGTSTRYNPRCLKRAVNRDAAQDCTADKTYSLITRHSTVSSFQDTMQGIPGVHVGGHFTMGGDPGGDINASPGDPAFYLHHAMIDRVWWLWQVQDLQSRLSTVAGNDLKTNRAGSLKDTVNLGILNGDVELGALLNTLGGNGGEFCYIYM